MGVMQTVLSILQKRRAMPLPKRGAVSLAAKMALCALLVAAADFLFYGEPAGWTAGLYAALTLGCLRCLHGCMLAASAGKIVAFLLCSLLLPLVAQPGILPVALFIGGLLLLLTAGKRAAAPNAALWLKDACRLALHIPVQWVNDLRLVKRAAQKGKAKRSPFRQHAPRLILPLALAAAFCWLFLKANPVISRLAALVDWGKYLGDFLSPLRWLSWALLAVVLWAALRPRPGLGNPVTLSPGNISLDRWLDRRSLAWSLALFNLLFAVQNGLDIAFLWGGQGKLLPDGMTLAEYAHAGAYPLIITALLAGGYVLVAFDDHHRQYQTRAARALVAAWVAQNVFLVISSIDRTLLYIESYSLTFLRVAALIWMGLIALGLCLVVARIFLGRNNAWLVNMNALALAAALYACCFVNFDRIIADYNVRHAREITGTGAALDVSYLHSLGPEALPALRWFESHASAQGDMTRLAIGDIEKRFLREFGRNWRSWTWRRQYIFNHHLTPKEEETRQP